MASLDNTLGSMYRNMIGLLNVDNTSDLNKPISIATQTALNTKAPILNPIFTGSVTLPNVDINTTNNNLAATTSFVNTKVSTIPLKLPVDLVAITNQTFTTTVYNYDISSAAFSIDSADFAFGTGDFTCEAWINVTSIFTTAGSVIFDTRINGLNNNSGIQLYLSPTGYMGYSYVGIGLTYSTIAKVDLNTLTHIVYQRVGNNIQLYVNGIYKDQLNFNQNLSSSQSLIIGRVSDIVVSNNSYKFKGTINNIRITRAAVYSGNFTPSVILSALTNTILLISNNPVTDISGTNKSITIEGSITYNTIINTGTWVSGIDTVVPTINNRILFVGQTDQKENGIYVMTNSTTLNRSSDFPLNYAASGTNVFIKLGTQYANTNWVCTNLTGSDIVGTNNLIFNSIKTDIIPISKVTNLQTSLDTKLNLTSGTLTGGLTGTSATFSGSISAGSITTISSTFQQVYVSGVKDVSSPASRGIYLGLDNNSLGGIDICSDLNQYIDFTTITNNYRGRLIYNNTDNDFKMHVNGNSSASLTLNNSTLTTNNITGSVGSFDYIVCNGTTKKPKIPTAAGATLGIDSDDFCGLGLCGPVSYIDFGPPNVDYNGRLIYENATNNFKMILTGGGTVLTLDNTTLSTKNITGLVGSFDYIVCSGQTNRPTIPQSVGAILGCGSNGDSSTLELCGNTSGYIDFTQPGVDYKGRFMYVHSDRSFTWYTDQGTLLTLTATAFTGPTYSATSDKRLKFNEKPLTNALEVINKLEPLEYDQTQDIVDQFNENIPHTHQCGFIAQSIQQIDQLKYAVTGGEIREDGKETIRTLNYNAIFTYAVKSIQELHAIVKEQQEQIDAQKEQIDELINTILNA